MTQQINSITHNNDSINHTNSITSLQNERLCYQTRWYYYYPYFTGKELGLWRLCKLSNFT